MNQIKRFIVNNILLFLLSYTLAAQERLTPENKACIACEELLDLRFPEVVITEATIISEKTSYCKVLGTIGREINFELLLPGDWNRRFFMGGGGGFVGSIANGARWSVHDGYATSGTDTGHKGHGLKADWAYDNMERQINFGHLAIHRTALVSKAIIGRYYCHDPEYSYFMGCSRGGGQAMMEAQRYPEDFDGIIVGAPAFGWPAIAAEFIQNIQAIYPDPDNLEPVITRQNLYMLQAAVLDQCDKRDGIEDSILNDPEECDFDLSALPTCPDDVIGEECFTIRQLKAIQTVYDGISSDQGEIYPGFPPGGENEPGGWMPWITGPNEGSMEIGFPSLHFGFGTEMFKYLIFQDPAISDFVRLFMLPGVLHCSNGPGPVFPYPRKAVYDGKGDPNLESSFK